MCTSYKQINAVTILFFYCLQNRHFATLPAFICCNNKRWGEVNAGRVWYNLLLSIRQLLDSSWQLPFLFMCTALFLRISFVSPILSLISSALFTLVYHFCFSSALSSTIVYLQSLLISLCV